MQYTLQTLCSVTGGRLLLEGAAGPFEHMVFDSRRVVQPARSIFFAIRSAHGDGHYFIADAYKKGVRCFMVSSEVDLPALEGASVIQVADTVSALQGLARHHRSHFHYPVLAITGSNGKTIVKEWLYQLLDGDRKVHRSPKSYNSQIGVPLSVWGMGPEHDLSIIEAGISAPGEMKKLQQVIQPTIGLLTNIGEAHDEGFASLSDKLREKCILFKEAQVVIGEWELLQQACPGMNLFAWSKKEEAAQVFIREIIEEKSATTIVAVHQQRLYTITIPFVDEASVQNAMQCLCVLLYLGVDVNALADRFRSLHAVDMRLQLKHGINGCVVINDSYSADTTSLRIALDFLKQQGAGMKRTVILSDFMETGKTSEVLYKEIAALLQNYAVARVVVVGEKLAQSLRAQLQGIDILSFATTEDLLLHFKGSQFYNEIILVKGARVYGFERVAALFEVKQHQTVLEIDLNALVHNLKEYQSVLQPGTRIMAMVKAFSYGSGGAEIASVLQFHNVHYLGVAYADEGVELVKSGISLPIMVMNAEASTFSFIVDHHLQPVIYSMGLLQEFERYIREQGLASYPVHIEVETGMNRLGFALSEMPLLAQRLAASPLRVQTVFSHLAASEEAAQDNFTQQQAATFSQAVAQLKGHLSYPFLQHILNSAGIIRHPGLQMDMVRLGIGLYGIEVDGEDRLDLRPVATLRSTIAQLKRLKAGESVSYNRRGKVERDSLIATVRIGYADGYNRAFGQGKGKMLVRGQLVPTIGTVCMDMTMIDVTDIAGVREGEDVVVFGAQLPVETVAGWIGTIPYEIMTAVSQRVKRIYFHE